jgi:hypothetical protein
MTRMDADEEEGAGWMGVFNREWTRMKKQGQDGWDGWDGGNLQPRMTRMDAGFGRGWRSRAAFAFAEWDGDAGSEQGLPGVASFRVSGWPGDALESCG